MSKAFSPQAAPSSKRRRAVVLYSGGIDSMLAVRVLQSQGLEVEALNVRTVFTCCQTRAAQSASQLGVRLTVVSVGDDYVELIRNPRHGYGKGLNPCVDCRIYMCRMAKHFMEDVGASFVATGEVLGQRPMSQKRPDLNAVEHESGLADLLLRPLSAKRLRPTLPEREGWVDREKLYGITGRSRRELIGLAATLGFAESGITQLPAPSSGCALTEASFAPRVRELVNSQCDATRPDFELLNHGRHFRFDADTKIILGRNQSDNALLRAFATEERSLDATIVCPENFRGPDGLITGNATDNAIAFAGALMLRYGRCEQPGGKRIRVVRGDIERIVDIFPDDMAMSAKPL